MILTSPGALEPVSVDVKRSSSPASYASPPSLSAEPTPSNWKSHSVKFKVDKGLNKFCSSNSKWALDNPGWCHEKLNELARIIVLLRIVGIIVAGCLQEVLKVPFADALATDSVAHNATILSSPIRKELFNVYGPVRLVTADIDDWYMNMKNRVVRATVPKLPSLAKTNILHDKHTLGGISKHVVSFHYVSEAESRALFNIFSQRLSSVDSRQLYAMWPKGADVGDYARPLHSLAEAETIATQLSGVMA